MKKLRQLLFVGALCVGTASIAMADVPAVSLEYSSTSRADGNSQPLSQVKTYVSVEPGRVRKLSKYVVNVPDIPTDALPTKGTPFGALFSNLGGYHAGGIGIISDLNNDKFIAYSSELNSYIEEPRLEFYKKLRFDPFSKIDPQLSEQAPPELTAEQRERLGREVGSVARAFLKKNMRVYFRPLQGSRNFKALDGVKTQGYRMTLLLNVSKPGNPPRWTRTAAEWWIAEPLPGDDMIRKVSASDFDDLQRIGGISTSMWINEALPVLWESLPQEFRDAVQTYMPLPPASNAWYRGTLAYLAVTAEGPLPSGAKQVVRTETTLKSRSTAEVRDSLFRAPGTYQKQDIGFLLDMYKTMSASLFDEDGPLSNLDKMGNAPFGMPLANTQFLANFRDAVR